MEHSRIIAKQGENVLGWEALSPVSGRCMYAGVAEVSVYVSSTARGKGLVKHLLIKLIDESEVHNICTLQADIFPENIPSIKNHEDCGFRIISKRERIGKINGLF